ncbi:uncharacterized protein MELLADRAFT_86553 [Melampsora larici-populina 98AG31]|uniref:tRNA-splicing endonuclease subunit Sen2 n=1 Tax=Melampsora larici-populina (strain 98AG31 / pathotype 3-4-7) TaxID=747676 RepID=F4RM76_MELLP|nr:uncharacterized protein MELLADRAFT_86553 [Melampsora larici-populina 98AG31]EGG06516.1 hypothetical protein MELLADRAFT_86553 [Melampsora larici-populina 98AG31]
MSSTTTTTNTNTNKPITKSESIQSKPKKIKAPNIYSNLLPINLSTSNTYHPFTYLKAHLWFSNQSTTSSHQIIYGKLDSISNQISVTGDHQFQILWRCGFFGKGNLSRSEPTWLQRAKNRHALNVLQSDHGLKLTAEELTAKRRIERREAKIEKAKEKEREKEKEMRLEGIEVNEEIEKIDPPIEEIQSLNIKEEIIKETDQIEHQNIKPNRTKPSEMILPIELLEELDSIVNLEHLQLKPEDAFFLSYGIGCLQIEKEVSETDEVVSKPENKQWFSINELWETFCSNADRDSQRKPDNPFIVSYVTYHHFRSLGWVVRDGIKFCVDWVLYGSRGPVGGHAEFAVCVIPVYEDPNDQEELHQSDLSNQKKNWKWLSTVNRVCSGVKKM